MNYVDTLCSLKEETENISVMACGAYSDHRLDIGIRVRTRFDETMCDPIIDGVPFMICGDIYFEDHERIYSVDVLETQWENCYVRLRAIYLLGVYSKIELGRYKIEKCEKVSDGEWCPDKAYRLSLVRIK